ncbi:Lrrc56 [Symbiodinium necroappetens]|uniref:Lrrc56 protein n=1 Tax=Symbiodinium necroappetens TaxID=1628268 RepID=A0A813CF44_9DINO|nr:Lrrc56 [Symbiodinium sp. KB8]CAE7942288.1 Lrrc56 [Symbiodinium necroappetens]
MPWNGVKEWEGHNEADEHCSGRPGAVIAGAHPHSMGKCWAQAREEMQKRACVEEELQELRAEKSKLQEELRNVAEVAKGSLETSMPARHVGGSSTPSSQSVIADPLVRPELPTEGPAQNCSDNCKNRCNMM